MASEVKPAPKATDASAKDEEEGLEDTTITLFAPFEVQKPSRSLFQRSADRESDFSSSKSESRSREIEFQNSEAPSSGNPKVIFRKLKAAVSSSSGTTSKRPQELSVTVQPPAAAAAAVAETSVSSSQRSKISPTPSTGSSNPASSSSNPASSSSSIRQGYNSGEANVVGSVERALSEETKISLTSYSDAHRRTVKHPLLPPGGPGGVARPQSQGEARPQLQAVNKTEMLKRFGSIADNKVQVFQLFLLNY